MAANTAASDISDGPVLNLLNKRLRALRKKLNRIHQMEDAISQGKPINKEQEDVLRSKASVIALIDELEKLRQPLSSAVSEEIDLALQTKHVTASSQPASTDDSPSNIAEGDTNGDNDQSDRDAVENLLNLLYFGSLFDVKSQSDFTSTMLTRTHERGCCLTYDYVTDDATDLLAERDLDLISTMSGLLISRPVDSNLPHKNALERCIEHAKLWLQKADQPINPNTDVTYANLRDRLHKIMASDYFTTTPEIKGPVEVAAVATGNYANFQVPVPVHEDDSDAKFQPTDVEAGDLQGDDISDGQPSSADEPDRDVLETENSGEPITQQEVKAEAEVEPTQADTDSKEQQSFPRRTYTNQRGSRGVGGRRGYPNGRGGRGDGRGGGSYQDGRGGGSYQDGRGSGSYQDGRGGGSYQNGRNRYYDQPGNYYQRNYYNNGRGRGGRGGGHSYNSHGSAQGAPNSATIGVAS